MIEKSFPEKIKKIAYNIYNGYCCIPRCHRFIHSYHHRLAETIYNIKKFPLFIHSILNCAPVCSEHHNNHRNFDKLNLSEKEAIAIENYLNELKNTNKSNENIEHPIINVGVTQAIIADGREGMKRGTSITPP